MDNQFADQIELNSNVPSDYFSYFTDEELKRLVKIAIKGSEKPDNYLAHTINLFNERYPENSINAVQGIMHVLMVASVRWYNSTPT